MKNEMRYEVLLYTLGSKTVYCHKCGDRRRVPVEKGLDVGLATKLLTLSRARALTLQSLLVTIKTSWKLFALSKALDFGLKSLRGAVRFQPKWKLNHPPRLCTVMESRPTLKWRLNLIRKQKNCLVAMVSNAKWCMTNRSTRAAVGRGI